MIHQFGHMLGLGHSARQTSVMTPFYLDWVAETEVGPDLEDKDALRLEEPYSGSQRLASSLMLLLLLVIIL